MKTNTGKGWARFALIFGAAASILGNETHTVLTPGPLDLIIRMVFAAFWPAALFIAVEVLVRVPWRKKFLDFAGRALMLIPVGIVAAVVSYQHIHSLMIMGAEDPVSSTIGPLAIDGLMIGGTVALLVIRALSTVEPVTDIAPAIERLERLADEHTSGDWDRAAEIELGQQMIEIAPTSPAAPRAPRSGWDARKLAELIVDGAKDAQIKDATGASPTTAGRFRKVAKALQSDPRAAIDSAREKVHPDHVAIIRDLVTRS